MSRSTKPCWKFAALPWTDGQTLSRNLKLMSGEKTGHKAIISGYFSIHLLNWHYLWMNIFHKLQKQSVTFNTNGFFQKQIIHFGTLTDPPRCQQLSDGRLWTNKIKAVIKVPSFSPPWGKNTLLFVTASLIFWYQVIIVRHFNIRFEINKKKLQYIKPLENLFWYLWGQIVSAFMEWFLKNLWIFTPTRDQMMLRLNLRKLFNFS